MTEEDRPPYLTRKEDILPRIPSHKCPKPQIGKFTKDLNVSQIFNRLIAHNFLVSDPIKEVIYKKKEADKDLIAPTCCTAHNRHFKRELVGRDCQQRYLTCYTPPASAWKKRKHYAGDALEREVFRTRHWNERYQYPLRTIKVYWHEQTNSIHSVMEKLAPYGHIENMVMGIHGNSAIVVFSTLSEACKVVDDHMIGQRHDTSRLSCKWLHKNLEKKTFLRKNNQLYIKYNPYIKAAA